MPTENRIDDWPASRRREVLSWMRALQRMEAHVLDAGHLLLETHATPALSLMVDFIRRTHARRMDRRA